MQNASAKWYASLLGFIQSGWLRTGMIIHLTVDTGSTFPDTIQPSSASWDTKQCLVGHQAVPHGTTKQCLVGHQAVPRGTPSSASWHNQAVPRGTPSSASWDTKQCLMAQPSSASWDTKQCLMLHVKEIEKIILYTVCDLIVLKSVCTVI